MRDISLLPIIDVECTCYNGGFPEGETQEIIEIGIVLLNTKSLEIERAESLLIAPTHSKISPFCTQLTTLTPESFANADLTFAKACKYLENTYGTLHKPWASWGDFDRHMFERQCKLEDVPYPFADTHLNLRVLYSLMTGQSKRVSVPAALDQIHVKFKGTPHRGIDDAINIANIFRWCIEHKRS